MPLGGPDGQHELDEGKADQLSAFLFVGHGGLQDGAFLQPRAHFRVVLFEEGEDALVPGEIDEVHLMELGGRKNEAKRHEPTVLGEIVNDSTRACQTNGQE